MKLNILAFGVTKEILGKRMLELELPLKSSAKIGDLRHSLYQKYPDLQKLNSLGIAQGTKYTQDEDLLDANLEIALIPPVSGG